MRTHRTILIVLASWLVVAAAAAEEPYTPFAGEAARTRLFWGDTHLHTAISGDAITDGNRLGPEQAYRFARGLEVKSSSGQPAVIGRPLDFLVIADHAEAYGLGREMLTGNEALLEDETIRRWHEAMKAGGRRAYDAGQEMRIALASGELPAAVSDPKIAGPIIRSTWRGYTDAAERYNEPGLFTALIGYEWTSLPGGNNLHRVVVMRDGKERADQILPFSAIQSEDPEKLWEFMAGYEAGTGGRILAIPHNGNISNGRMFALADFAGRPMTRAYAEARSRWEPLVEVTQMKGDGETHPALSPDDEFADFGRWDAGNLTLSELKRPEMLPYEYARSTLKNGLLLERELGANPFQFGMLGATDSHTSLADTSEDNHFGKASNAEPSPTRASDVTKEGSGARRFGWQNLASGIAAVWAKENTRAALFDAMARREVYATTGSRMRVRFFGGYRLRAEDSESSDLAVRGYAGGVPMGGELGAAPGGRSPGFLVSALKDPLGGNLDRIQIVKGWLDAAGALHEHVYDVSWADAERRQPGKDGRVPPVGDTVDAATATWTNAIGDAALSSFWRDPDFDAAQPAFYYARVIEIPTPRWTTYDAVRLGIELSPEIPRTTRERAYTSPIWYSP